jgi:hypothetical protein
MGEEKNVQALLFAAMAAVLGEIRRVPKNGRNDFHKYDYVTEGDLVDAVRDILSAHGMSFWPSVVEHKEEEVKNARGKTEFKATVTLSVTFAHSNGGSVTTTWVGQGVDASDKAYYKAYTGAVKYALMKTFMVSTGDDPEQEEPGPRRQERAPVPHKKREPKKPGEILAQLDAACTEATDAETSSAFLTLWAKRVAEPGASSELLDVIMTVPQKAEAMRRKLDGFNPRQRAEYIRKVLADKPQASQHSG